MISLTDLCAEVLWPLWHHRGLNSRLQHTMLNVQGSRGRKRWSLFFLFWGVDWRIVKQYHCLTKCQGEFITIEWHSLWWPLDGSWLLWHWRLPVCDVLCLHSWRSWVLPCILAAAYLKQTSSCLTPVSFRSELIPIIFPPHHSLTLGALQPEAEPGRLPGDPQDGQRVTWTPAVYCVPHLKVACWRASLTHFHLSFWFFFSLFLTAGLFAVHQRFPDRRIVRRRDWGTFPIISASVTVCLELRKLVSLD